jgi:hypothetical protein
LRRKVALWSVMGRLELAEVRAGIAKMKAPRQLGWQVLVMGIEPHHIGPPHRSICSRQQDIRMEFMTTLDAS